MDIITVEFLEEELKSLEHILQEIKKAIKIHKSIDDTKIKFIKKSISSKTIVFHTDGACSGNPGPGGWAIVSDPINNLYLDAYENAGNEQNTTNARMELKAIIEVFKLVKLGEKFVIYSDSKNTVDTINKNWKRNANLDLWEEFDKANHKHNGIIFWEKRDSTDGNKRANAIAQIEAQKFKE